MQYYINLWDARANQFDHISCDTQINLLGRYHISIDNEIIMEGEYNNGIFNPPRINGDCIVYWCENPEIILYKYNMISGKFMQIIADESEFCYNKFNKMARLICINMIEGGYNNNKLHGSYKIYKYDPYSNIREIWLHYNYNNGAISGLQYEYDNGRLHVRYNMTNNKRSDIKYYCK
jgi:hypothetical protein